MLAVVISFIHGTPHAMEEEKVTLGVGIEGRRDREGWNFHLARGARLIDYWFIHRIRGGHKQTTRYRAEAIRVIFLAS